jgi:hypothetical protein
MKVMEKPIANKLMDIPLNKYFSILKSQQIRLVTFIAFLAVIFVYVWYCSYEFWTNWPTHTLFYDPLATAFANGSLALEEEVDPSLLDLTNPYDPRQRKKLDFPMDFSLYKGKYYLYFGPAPALPLVILKFFGLGKIGDQYLVFAGVTGLFIFQSLLIISIRKRFFQTIPIWTVPLSIVFAGLIAPLPRLLTDGRVYETAIAVGQGFFLAGLYFIVTALGEKDKSAWRLIAAGSFWALAIGSRITQILPVGFMAFMLIVFAIKTYISTSRKSKEYPKSGLSQPFRDLLYMQTKSFSKAAYPLVMVGLPLAVGIAMLGWYNWARFGDVFETGISYQLTTPDLQKYRDVLISPLYVLPNLYNYIAAPPKVNNVFPFLQSIRGKGNLLFPFIELPKVYYTRSMTGILYSTPFVVFAGISVLSALFLKTRREESLGKPDNDAYMLKWLLFSLLGSFLLPFIFNVSFFWVETRYFADFTPSLILLSIMGFWLGYRALVRWPVAHKIYVTAGISLLLLSVLSSNLLLFSNQASVYQFLFPERWDLLSNISSRLIAILP